VDEDAHDQLEGALRFFLTPKAAFNSGKFVHLSACPSKEQDWTRPLAGRKAEVPGAARGIGPSIAETQPRDGAHEILL
ncbi:short chain dehydrogenase, partial [Pseudomonas syringae pv. tagetis]